MFLPFHARSHEIRLVIARLVTVTVNRNNTARRCGRWFVGRLCELYRRCYDDSRLCYETDYERRDYDSATQHCRRRADFTSLPVVVDRFESLDLRLFVEDDPTRRLTGDSVWLGAKARRLTDDSAAVHWHWLDGLTTRMWTVSDLLDIGLTINRSLRLRYSGICAEKGRY